MCMFPQLEQVERCGGSTAAAEMWALAGGNHDFSTASQKPGKT